MYVTYIRPLGCGLRGTGQVTCMKHAHTCTGMHIHTVVHVHNVYVRTRTCTVCRCMGVLTLR